MSLYCKDHNVKCIFKEAGTRKDGTPYNAFYACPLKGADGGFCKGKKIEEAEWLHSQGGQAAADTPAKVEKAPDWDEIALGKVRHGIAVAMIEKVGPQWVRDENYLKLAAEVVDWVMGKSKIVNDLEP